ncbi:MAG: hypothetical protein NTZ05_07870, partial [Chloroflexi bacterium]|nr:hypothetical protein [Chloroflexota bacterium]
TEPPTVVSPLISLHLFLFGGFLPPPLTALSLVLVLLVPALALTTLRRGRGLGTAPSPPAPFPQFWGQGVKNGDDGDDGDGRDADGRGGSGGNVPRPPLSRPPLQNWGEGWEGGRPPRPPLSRPPLQNWGEGWEGGRPPRSSSGPAYLALLLGIPVAAALTLSLVRPVYLERTLIGSVPAWCLLLGWSLGRIQPPAAVFFLRGLLLILAVAGLARWYHDPSSAKTPYRWAADVVRSRWQEGDAVVHTSDSSLLPFLVYLPDTPQAVLEGDPVVTPDTVRGRPLYSVLPFPPTPPREAGAGARRVWLVVAPEYSAAWQWAAAAEFRSERKTLGEWELRGVYAILLDRAGGEEGTR